MVYALNVNKVLVKRVIVFTMFVKIVLMMEKIWKNIYLMVNVLQNVQNFMLQFLIINARGAKKDVKYVNNSILIIVYNVKIEIMNM